MFPRSRRLQKSQDILATFRRGERIRSGTLTFFYLPGSIPSRATVIVDKKVSKKAVVRNLLKRKLRALLHHRLPENGLIVVRCFPGTEKLSFEELTSAVDRCLNHPRLRQNS